MNALQKFLARKSKAKVNKGDLGQESEWLEFSTLNLKGTKLLICDAMFVPSEDDGLSVKLKSGQYHLSAKVMSYGSDRRVSRLRILPPDTEVKLGGVVGETWADTALIAVCDLEVCTKASEVLGEDKMEDICNDLLDKGGDCGVMVLDKKSEAVAPYVSSGFGDGTFKVFKLLNNRKTVGVEIEFIKVGTPYPFDLTAAAPKKEPKILVVDSSKLDSEEAKKIFAEFKVQRTGDAVKDKALLKARLKDEKAKAEDQVWEIYRDFRKHVVDLRRKAPPVQINYVPTVDIAWTQKDEAKRRIDFLESENFSLVGYLECPQIPNYWVGIFVRATDSIIAEVAQGQDGSVLLCFSAEYGEGNDFVVIDKPSKAGMTQSPWITKHFFPDMVPQELLTTFLKTRPAGCRVHQSNAEIISGFEDGFRRVQSWRAERGGWTPAEIKTQMGVKVVDSQELVDKVQSTEHSLAEKWFYAWLKLQPQLPFVLEDVIESLVIVHDNLSLTYLHLIWGSSTGDVNAKISMFDWRLSRCAAFAKVNQERGNKLRLVVQKHTPLEADFYLPA